jgi:hypothetical protein
MLTNTLKEIIQVELTNDPSGRNYSGKSAEEIADILNSPYEVEITVKHLHPSRINQCFVGIPYAPNAVTVKEVEEILNA